MVHKQNDEHKERERLKAKQYGLSSKIDALAERIAILPREISSTPLFKQLGRFRMPSKNWMKS